MIPVVLASVAVYAGTAGLCLFLAHRFVLPLRLGAALTLAALPLLFTGQATATGGVVAPIDVVYQYQPFDSRRAEEGIGRARTPLLSDVVFSMIPWQRAVRESVARGRAPLWNRFVLAGEPLLAVQQPAVLHPLTWLGFLLPFPQAWTFQMSARLLVALLSAFLFCRSLGAGEAAALAGAIAWGFSGFVVFWIGYPVGNAVGPLPLLLVGLTRLVSDADRRAAALTVAALVLIVTAGHPEALLFCVAGGGVYFLTLLALAGRGRRLRPFLLSLAAGALALGICSAQLLPLAEALPRTWEHAVRSQWFAHVKKSAPLRVSARMSASALLPFAPAARELQPALPANFAPPGAYAGLLVLPLAVSGLLARDRRKWALLAMGLAGFALALRLAGWTDAVTRLPVLDVAVVEYAVLLPVLAWAGLAALGAQTLSEGRGRGVFLAAGSIAAAAAVGLFLRFHGAMRELGSSEVFLRQRLAWELGPVLLALGGLALFRRAGTARLLPGAIALLLLVGRFAEERGVYPTYPARAFFPHLALLDPIPRSAPERIVGLQYEFVPNASAMYGLEDVRGYESMTLRSLVETFPLWCTPQPAWFNRVDDLDKPFLAFLNVRWALVPPGTPPPPGWRLAAAERGGALLESDHALPRALVPARIRAEPDGERRIALLSQIRDFAAEGVIDEAGRAPAGWAPNGSARVAIAAYRPPDLSLDVDAREPAIIGTSVTAWPGWRTTLDGAPIRPLTYNHAFLGFSVPAGRHRLELRYRPGSFLAGSAMSALSLILAVALALGGRAAATRVLSSPAPPW